MILFSKMTVFKRILFGLFAIVFVTFITLFFIASEVRDTIRDHALTRIHKILLHKLNTIDMYANQNYISLNNLKMLIYFASRHHPIFEKKFWDNPPETLEKNMSIFANNNGFYDLFVITLDGDILYTVKHERDLHTNLLKGQYRNTELARVFNGAHKNEKAKISNFDYYAPSDDFAAFIAEPMVENGKIIGVMAIQIDNKNIQNVINDYSELGKTGEIIATFNHKGKILTAAPIRHSTIQAFDETDSLPIAALKGKWGECYMLDRFGRNVGVAWGYQDDFRMNIAVKIDESELLKTWYRQFVMILLLFLAGSAVVISMMIALFRSFSKPIEILTQYAAELSEGRYDIPIEDKQYDLEWQLLIRAFQKMTLDIHQTLTQLNQQNFTLLEQKKEIEALNENLEERIRLKSIKLQKYIDTVDHYVIISQTDKYGNIIYASEAFCQISGYSKEELIGKTHRIIRHPDMPKELFVDIWHTITSGETWHGEIKNSNASGGYYWVDTTISPDIEEGEIIGYTAVRHDISDKKIIEELAITDSMTGLYNRRYYVKKIQEEMNRVKRHDSSLALMMIDVDYFKLYNDTYGHQEGDKILTLVAGILKAYTSRSGEYAFRLGGEEFGILVSGMSEEEYIDLGNRIRIEIQNMSIPHAKNDVSPFVTISMGIALYDAASEISCEELYKEADTQLYKAKANGRNQVMIHSES
ncbi:MAG TPA: diguanylate cyclase [Sulfuricurvum sp.]|nr:diguanylate cyclase [Sulfuricurvum sp.]